MMVAMVSDPTDLVVICCFQLWIPTHQYIRFYCPCVCVTEVGCSGQD